MCWVVENEQCIPRPALRLASMIVITLCVSPTHLLSAAMSDETDKSRQQKNEIILNGAENEVLAHQSRFAIMFLRATLFHANVDKHDVAAVVHIDCTP